MLLEAEEGSLRSLEVLDDVAEQTGDGKAKLIQSKSSLTANPVADRAIPLWKTLFNWLEIVKRGLVNPARTVFELYVSRQVEGELISDFNRSRSPEEARFAVNKARKQLWGEAPTYDKMAFLPEDLGHYANPVLEANSIVSARTRLSNWYSKTISDRLSDFEV